MITYPMKRLLVLPLLVLVALVAAGAPASAGLKTATVEFGAYPSIARAASGDTVELAGEGSFTLQPKSASGDAPQIAAAFGFVPRTFTHRDTDGYVVAEGTWEPTAVLSYQSYGPATEEQAAEFGGLPRGTEGGKMQIKVALYVNGEHVHDGIITIVCLLGVPPRNATEATLLKVLDTDDNFDQTVHSDNVFIRHV
jgi:hypothetical protein